VQKVIIFLIIVATYATSTSLAGIGDRETAIEGDSVALIASLPQLLHNRGPYKVYEIAKNNQTLTLREYTTQDGIVFGVAWEGKFHPNLDQILGAYWSEYHTHLENNPKPKGHRAHFDHTSEHIKVIKYGHMGWVQGKAYAPELFPAGVNADEIK